MAEKAQEEVFSPVPCVAQLFGGGEGAFPVVPGGVARGLVGQSLQLRLGVAYLDEEKRE